MQQEHYYIGSYDFDHATGERQTDRLFELTSSSTVDGSSSSSTLRFEGATSVILIEGNNKYYFKSDEPSLPSEDNVLAGSRALFGDGLTHAAINFPAFEIAPRLCRSLSHLVWLSIGTNPGVSQNSSFQVRVIQNARSRDNDAFKSQAWYTYYYGRG